jgi:hypothetical protein
VLEWKAGIKKREEEVPSLQVWRRKNREEGGGLDRNLSKKVVKGIRKEKQVPLSTALLRRMGPTSSLPTSFLPGIQTAFKKSLLGQVRHLNTNIGKEVQLHSGTEARSREEIQLNFDAGDVIRMTAAREETEHNG